MSVTAFSQYKVYEYVNSGTPALATYTGMTFTQDGTNFLDALNTSSQSVVSMPASYIATCDSNYRYNVGQMTSYSNIGANFPSNGSYEFENQTTKFVLKIKDLRGNIAYSKDLEIDMNTTYLGFFMNSNGIGGIIIYRINDANCDVVIKGNSTFDNMYKTVYTIDGRDPLPDLEGGGAGSGYIGNSLVSNKKMVGYNVPTSSATDTKTESINDVSASAVSDKPKSGNGFARIKLLSAGKNVTYKSIAKTSDMTHYVTGGDGSNANIQSAFSSYKNTDYILWSAMSSSVYSRERPFDYNNSTGIFAFNSANYSATGFYGYVLFPFIPKSKILKVSFKVRIQANSSVDFGVRLRDADLNSSTMLTMFLADPATQMDWATVEYTVPDAYRNTEYGWLQMHFQVKAEVKDIVFTYLE